jgi:hypothetical protein
MEQNKKVSTLLFRNKMFIFNVVTFVVVCLYDCAQKRVLCEPTLHLIRLLSGRTFLHCVGFEVLTAVSTKMAVFWIVAPCSLVQVYQHFRGPCCIYNRPDDGGSKDL